MKILYVSDNVYHHMIPFASSIVLEVGIENFKYAVLKPTEEFRVNMGFSPNDNEQPWIIRVYENELNQIEYEKWFYNADVVLFSNRKLFNKAYERVNLNKLTFYFSERWWKPNLGKLRLLHPEYIKLAIGIWNLSKNSNFHYLAQGGYAAKDIKFISKFENRIWDFGYFTDTSSVNMLKKKSKKIDILWCGRMLKWKKVDTLIYAFGDVIKKQPNCHLSLIGDGEEKSKLESLAKEILPHESYSFYPSQSAIKIRQEMNSKDIFVLSSSGYEGWGAVVNEAMAEGCCVIATIESGAGKSIIRDMENGILFKSGDFNMLREKLLILIRDEKLRKKITNNAQKNIREIWSPQIASNRLVKVCDAIINNKLIPSYEEGPLKRLN